MLPELAKGPGNTFWVIPSEVTTALQNVTKAFNGLAPDLASGQSPEAANGRTPEAANGKAPEITPD